jgi:putative membrane protein
MKTAVPYALSTGSMIVALWLLYSGIHCYDRATWVMEIAPVLIVFPFLWRTYRTFPLTTFLYLLIVLHSIVLIIGGMYTYARVPFGFELAHWLGIERNPYDKIGHFMQGFVPFIAAREILIRGKFINGTKMLSFLVLCIVLAISATYELIEWGTAVTLG